jgi:hypothetical protein
MAKYRWKVWLHSNKLTDNPNNYVAELDSAGATRRKLSTDGRHPLLRRSNAPRFAAYHQLRHAAECLKRHDPRANVCTTPLQALARPV